jgi:hypothetical protein
VRTEARFPGVDPARGHYESFFLKAALPAGGRAIWIRYTIHKRPGAEPAGAVWVTWFDRERDRPLAVKQQYGPELVSAPPGGYLRIGESEIGPGRAHGACAAAGRSAAWDLRFEDRREPFRHLSPEWMYRRSLPRTKLLSPHPGASFSGS